MAKVSEADLIRITKAIEEDTASHILQAAVPQNSRLRGRPRETPTDKRVAQALSALEHANRTQLEVRRKALEQMATAGGALSGIPVPLPTPYLIWAQPQEILLDSNTSAWNSLARVKNTRKSQGFLIGFSESVSFYYYWDNPSDVHYALVNVSAPLTVKGVAVANGYTGIIDGGLAQIYGQARYELWHHRGIGNSSADRWCASLLAVRGGRWRLVAGDGGSTISDYVHNGRTETP